MTLIAALLLTLSYTGTWHLATRWLGDWRLGLGAAALAWFAWSVLWSEVLSLGDAFTQRSLLVVWGVPALASLVVLVRARRRPSWAWWTASTRLERAAFVVIAACLAVTLFVALWAAPNNWDSMTYHLARVEVWYQLEAVTHYATSIEPQLYQPPGAEFMVAQTYLLSGGSDVLAASVQWAAYLECIVVASLAAQALGGDRRVQLAAALLVATIPLAILEASSTQNDLVLASSLTIAATFAMVAVLADRPGRLLLIASVALGLAALTKGTGLLFGLPIGVLIAGVAIRRLGVVRAVPLALVGLALVVAPNVGQWARNHQTYGTFVASEHAGVANPYRVQEPGPRSLVSNLVRNATNHVDLPTDAANDHLEAWTVDALDALGIDASDPKTTFLGQEFRIGPFGPHEDHAGSLLLLVLGIWAAVSTILRRDRRQLAWLGMLTAQVLLFCWLVTWQNWHVRMHLPVTVAIAVLVAVRLGAARSRRLLVVACVVGSALAPIYLFFNVTRPLVGADSILVQSRPATRFQPRPQLRAPYEEVVERVAAADVRRVGLATGIDDWQHPLLVAFRRRGIDITQVVTSGPSRVHASGDMPDQVVCVSCQEFQRAAFRAAGLHDQPLDAGGDRTGRGDDVTRVELWAR